MRPGTTAIEDRLDVGAESSVVYRIDRIPGVDPAALARRPMTVRILVENLLRNRAKSGVDLDRIRRIAEGAKDDEEVPFFPARVLLQDFTGVPALVDLAAMRSAATDRGASARMVNPVLPVDLVVDHSVQVDSYASPRSVLINLDREYERNGERYAFLRWARDRFDHVRIVPPGNGIVHQVNLEYLASVVTRRQTDGSAEAFPDSLVGTDSHTTMVNGLGVLAWGVGGIEAEAVMLGEPTFLPTPTVVGVELTGALPEGSTATDLVLTITHTLRTHVVVDKFVEFFGPGIEHLSVADRATVSNMCPEYGATAALFPIDAASIRYLEATGRDPQSIARVRAYAELQGLWHRPGADPPQFDERLRIDLGTVTATVAGPRNPEEATPLAQAPESFRQALAGYRSEHPPKLPSNGGPAVADGAVVIAAITSCTNTSNPAVMVGAGLMARKARELGLSVPKWVKTSMAPGSKVVTAYLERAGLLDPLAALGFGLVGYGCTTCIGNSGPLPPEVDHDVRENDLYVAAVLSGNRNFEARINNRVRANYLASPMLVVAYALAGRMDTNLTTDPIGAARDGHPVYLKDLWPSSAEIARIVETSLDPGVFREKYRSITVGDTNWEGLPAIRGDAFPWDASSTYLRRPPYFELGTPATPDGRSIVSGARALALLGDRVTTDHISPAGEIEPESPAGRYLLEHGVRPVEFNTYGTRRGNHEVLVRGTFANVRLKNALVPGTEGGWTTHQPSGESMTIYDASVRYGTEGVPLIVLAGASYGQGSSRDWAAKGPRLLGVRAVVAKSFERIHRSNLVGMGVLPLDFPDGRGWKELGVQGNERFSLALPRGGALGPRAALELLVEPPVGRPTRIPLRCRIDSEVEMSYYEKGGLLPYVLDRLLGRAPPVPG